MTVHGLGPDAPHGFFDPGLAPVLTVEPGDTVRFGTLEAGWSVSPFPPDDLAARTRHPAWTPAAGHALTGPVAVRGATAGGTLEVRIDTVVPGTWGTTYADVRDTPYNRAYGLSEPAVHRWDLDPVAGVGRNQHGHTVALRPFLGVIGMPPPRRDGTLLGRLHGVSRADAVALASVAIDVRVTQIVNEVVGVHAVLPPGALR